MLQVARIPRLVCRSDQVVLTFPERPARGDRAVVSGRVRVYVDPIVARRLDRGVIDARPDGASTILVIREPRLMPPRLQTDPHRLPQGG
jgi:Fe-S cluster assembly iron-binding protein IscA